MKRKLLVQVLFLCCFAKFSWAQSNCNDWLGTWHVTMTDGTASTWVIDNATDQIKDNQDFILCRAYGVQTAAGAEDVKFQIVWLTFTNSYQFVPHQTPVTTADSGKTTELLFTGDKKHFIATLDNNNESLQHIRSGYMDGADPCTDYDSDGYGDNCPTGTDCNDKDPAVNPGAEEVCDDGIDNNCNDKSDADDESCGACPAAAVLGKDDPRLGTLRKFRDELMAKSLVGKKLIGVYYKNSAAIDAALDGNPVLKIFTQKALESAIPVIEKFL